MVKENKMSKTNTVNIEKEDYKVFIKLLIMELVTIVQFWLTLRDPTSF